MVKNKIVVLSLILTAIAMVIDNYGLFVGTLSITLLILIMWEDNNGID
jgi:hypothetical protein